MRFRKTFALILSIAMLSSVMVFASSAVNVQPRKEGCMSCLAADGSFNGWFVQTGYDSVRVSHEAVTCSKDASKTDYLNTYRETRTFSCNNCGIFGWDEVTTHVVRSHEGHESIL